MVPMNPSPCSWNGPAYQVSTEYLYRNSPDRGRSAAEMRRDEGVDWLSRAAGCLRNLPQGSQARQCRDNRRARAESAPARRPTRSPRPDAPTLAVNLVIRNRCPNDGNPDLNIDILGVAGLRSTQHIYDVLNIYAVNVEFPPVFARRQMDHRPPPGFSPHHSRPRARASSHEQRDRPTRALIKGDLSCPTAGPS